MQTTIMVGIILNQEDLPIPDEVFEIAKLPIHDPFEMALLMEKILKLLLTVSPEVYSNLNSEDYYL